jgi:DNA-binding PadR family transcriptional regulator
MGTTGLNRRARFYTITRDGRKQLGAEMEVFRSMIKAIERVLDPEG